LVCMFRSLRPRAFLALLAKVWMLWEFRRGRWQPAGRADRSAAAIGDVHELP
jgi:hypothetical protein